MTHCIDFMTHFFFTEHNAQFEKHQYKVHRKYVEFPMISINVVTAHKNNNRNNKRRLMNATLKKKAFETNDYILYLYVIWNRYTMNIKWVFAIQY